ncbi:phosphatases II [Lentinula edodes]|uniref:protein-tyrosine-phosphatase n=1 Tax=Lentinula edodes TaxID=5353 RepID=A0A1Q3EDS3_LENED|nr:phosphatases II [Lentinula edodes]
MNSLLFFRSSYSFTSFPDFFSWNTLEVELFVDRRSTVDESMSHHRTELGFTMIRFDNVPPEVMQAMCTPMHQVLAPSASSTSPSHATGSLYFLTLRGFPHFPKLMDLKPHLEDACNSIDRALRSGRNVLVHCQQGISRSAAVVIAYLIRNHDDLPPEMQVSMQKANNGNFGPLSVSYALLFSYQKIHVRCFLRVEIRKYMLSIFDYH